MKDFLKELCDNLNIKLIYTDYDYTALSAGINNMGPFIKANYIFKQCPERIAKAVIGYYTEPQRESYFLKVLTDYLNDNVVTVEYIIQPHDETYKDIFRHIENIEHAAKETPSRLEAKSKTSEVLKPKDSTSTCQVSGNDPAYIELDISSITKKNFYGGISNIEPDESIRASSDDVLELDILVDDSKI